MNYYASQSALWTPRGTIFYGSDGKPFRVEEKLSDSDADKQLFADAIGRIAWQQPAKEPTE